MITINIEYCGAWGYKPKADQLQKAIRHTYATSLKDIELTAGAGRTGSFEVTITTEDGNSVIVHSKLDGAGHVNEASAKKIMEAVGNAL